MTFLRVCRWKMCLQYVKADLLNIFQVAFKMLSSFDCLDIFYFRQHNKFDQKTVLKTPKADQIKSLPYISSLLKDILRAC